MTSNVPYHLKPNKHVERVLFMDTLDRLISRDVLRAGRIGYISMGGKMLEDQRLAYYMLGIEKLWSIESSATIFSRQQFNLPVGFIIPLQETSGYFVNRFDDFAEGNPLDNYIVWLDYERANARASQLTEFSKLLSTMTDGDIAKITINADWHTIAQESDQNLDYNERCRLQRDRVTNSLGKYGPSDIDDAELDAKGFVSICQGAIRRVAINATSSYNVYPLLVNSFCYNDGSHTMLTVTLRLCDAAKRSEWELYTNSEVWEYFVDDWDDWIDVSVPDLTLKEKLAIDREIGSGSVEDIAQKLAFRLEGGDERNYRQVNDYSKHHRRYPSFVKIPY